MQKILNFLLVIATVCLNSPAKADELDLNKLLSKLKDCNTQSDAKILEKSIWNLWETHPSNFQVMNLVKQKSNLIDFLLKIKLNLEKRSRINLRK